MDSARKISSFRFCALEVEVVVTDRGDNFSDDVDTDDDDDDERLGDRDRGAMIPNLVFEVE